MYANEARNFKCGVGNIALDSEYRKLFSIIVAIAHSFPEKSTTELLTEYEQLENALHAYFVIEESLAQAVNYDFTLHQLVHQGILSKFHYLKDELINSKCIQSNFGYESYIKAFSETLIRHIKLDDKPLKNVIQTNFYDFLDTSAYCCI